MDRSEIVKQIMYRKGHLLALPSEETGSVERFSVVAIRNEGDQLLLRSEAGSPRLREGMDVIVEVWGTDALYCVEGVIDQIIPKAQDVYIVVVNMDTVEEVQRRATPRYDTHMPTTFAPLSLEAAQEGNSLRRHAVGHATNIGLGGMQLETEYSLPVGTPFHFNVVTPVGTLHVEGRIVSRRKLRIGGYAYGVEYTRYDSLTSARLNRLVRRIEESNTSRRRWASHHAVPGSSVARRRRYARSLRSRHNRE